MQNSTTVEWAPFSLAAGVTEATLLEASRAIQRDFLDEQDGFVRRDLLRGDGGQWIDVVHWTSRDAAARAMEIAMQSPVCQRYFQLMVGVEHPVLFDRVATYGTRQ